MCDVLHAGLSTLQLHPAGGAVQPPARSDWLVGAWSGAGAPLPGGHRVRERAWPIRQQLRMVRARPVPVGPGHTSSREGGEAQAQKAEGHWVGRGLWGAEGRPWVGGTCWFFSWWVLGQKTGPLPESSPGRLLIPTLVLAEDSGCAAEPGGPGETPWACPVCSVVSRDTAGPEPASFALRGQRRWPHTTWGHTTSGCGAPWLSSTTPSPQRGLHPSPVLWPPSWQFWDLGPSLDQVSVSWALPTLCSGFGVLLSLCPGLSPPISPALDKGCCPSLLLLGGEGRNQAGLCACSGPPLLGVPSKAFGRCCVAGMAEPGTLEAPGSVPESGGRDPPGACCHSVSEPKRPGKGDSGAGFPKLPQTGGLAHLGLPRGRRADLSPRADVSDPLSVCSHPDTCFGGTR